MAFSGWKRVCELTLDHTKVQADTVDFPWLFTVSNLPSEMLDADGTYPALNGGGDIRFSADPNGNNRLSVEVVEFVTDNTPANGRAEIWVKIPFVSSNIDTKVYLWYGKSGQSQPARSAQYGSEDVWSDNFAVVQHYNQDPTGTAPQMTDSTNNANNGSARNSSYNSWQSSDLVNAKFGKGLYFDNTGAWDNCHDITFADSASLRPAAGWAIEFIFRQDNTLDGTWMQFFMKGHSNGGVGHAEFSYSIQLRDPSNDWQPLIGRGADLYGGPIVSGVSKEVWHHGMGTYEHESPDYALRMHLDGASSTTTATSSTATDFDTTGASSGNKEPQELWNNLEGILEEIRVHKTFRSPEYCNLAYVTTFDFTATTVGTPANVAKRITIGTASTGSGVNTPLQFNHTITSGVRRVLCVCVNLEGAITPSPISGVTYNGVSMTMRSRGSGTDATTYQYSEIWTLDEASLPVSGTYQVSITMSANYPVQAAAISFANVKQGGPEANANNYVSANTVISQSITTISDYSVVLSAIGSGNGALTYTQGTAQTEQWDFAGSLIDACGSTKEVAVAGSTSMSATASATANRLALAEIALAPFDASIVPIIQYYRSRIGGI